MPLVFDRELIQRILEMDRPWASYALADLEPRYFSFTSWYCTPDHFAICLLYRAFARPVVICVGQSQQLDSLLQEVDDALGDSQELYAVMRLDAFALVKKHHRVIEERLMLRMVLDSTAYRSVPHHGVTRLGPGDLEAVETLYAAEPPDFFLPEMLQDGVYFGIYEDKQLIAVAGTHVVAPTVGVAGLGNVYTRRNRRGLRHSTRVTSAVTAHLVDQGFVTIALNVRHSNDAAIHVYERLGYRRYCSYYEAIVLRGEQKPG